MKTYRTLKIITTAAIVLAVSCVSLTVRSPEAAAMTGPENQIAAEFGNFINNERVHRGLPQVRVSVSDSISSQMANSGCLADPTSGPGDGFGVATCANTSGDAVVSFLTRSEGHNRILMKTHATQLTVGAACVNGQLRVGAWVTDPLQMVHLPDGTWTTDDPSAPFSPAVTSAGAGSPCPATPPPSTTLPPVTAPPATNPPVTAGPTSGPAPTAAPTAPAPHSTPAATVPSPAAQAPGTTVVLPDGSKRTKASDGSTVTVTPGGTKITKARNGTTVTVAPNGTKTTVAKDGTKTVITKDGKKTVTKPSAATTTRKNSDRSKVTSSSGDASQVATAAGPHAAASSSSNGWWWAGFGALALLLVAGAAVVLFLTGKLPFFHKSATDQE